MKKKNIFIKFQKGATIVETVFVIAIIVVLSFMVIVSFPRTQKRLVLSRATYALAQNFKIVQDMALSKNLTADSFGNLIEPNSYGIYLDLEESNNEYIIYANLDDDPSFNNQPLIYCSKTINPIEDCILEKKNLGEDKDNVFVKKISNTSNSKVSVNFSGDSGVVFISNLLMGYNNIEIILESKDNLLITKGVLVNTAGLIEVK